MKLFTQAIKPKENFTREGENYIDWNYLGSQNNSKTITFQYVDRTLLGGHLDHKNVDMCQINFSL